MRSDRERLADILECCALLGEHVSSRADRLLEDPVLLAATQHWLQTIGEAASHVSQGLRERYTDVSWRGVIGMRQILVHGYFHVDIDVVRRVLEEDLPKLERHVMSILKDLERGD
ncbi:MAG: HepT-like ribonuclease domain-containing protein [Gaiellaceae bacterium]